MATLTRLEPGAPSLRAANLDRLECLAGVLTARGAHADVMAPPGRIPRLRVDNPGAGRTGDVYAWRCRDGNWWYWWPWAERIAPAGELSGAADRVLSALAPAAVS